MFSASYILYKYARMFDYNTIFFLNQYTYIEIFLKIYHDRVALVYGVIDGIVDGGLDVFFAVLDVWTVHLDGPGVATGIVAISRHGVNSFEYTYID